MNTLDHNIYVSEKQSLAKIIAGVRGGSSPPAEVWRQSLQGFSFDFDFDFDFDFTSPQGGLGAQPQGFDFVFLPKGQHVLPIHGQDGHEPSLF